MLFFQQSAVVDKGLDIHDIKYRQIETFVGSYQPVSLPFFIIIATGAVFYHKPPIAIEDATQTAEAIVPFLPVGQGDLPGNSYAIGLFDAGFPGSSLISLSTSWAVGEVFGWAHSLNTGTGGALVLFIYLLFLPLQGADSPHSRCSFVTITMFVQVVAVTLLPAALIFLLLLLK